MFVKYKNINYMIVTQDLVCNSILGLHLGRGVVGSVRLVSLVRMVSLARMVCLFRKVKQGFIQDFRFGGENSST